MVHYFENGAARACLGIGCCIDQAGDTCVENRTGAHGARLKGHDERATAEPVVAQVLRCSAHGNDLSVCRRITVANDAIVAASDDLAIEQDHCAHGNFTVSRGGVRLGDSGLHGIQIGHNDKFTLWEVYFVGGATGVVPAPLPSGDAVSFR